MTDERIEEIWDAIEDAEPDHSTEYLIARVIDQVSDETGEQLDAGHIMDALERRQREPYLPETRKVKG